MECRSLPPCALSDIILSMQITFADVAARFDAILTGSMSRVEADRWAWGMMQADDAGQLEVLPAHDHPRVWEGLTYLFGIDMPNPDTNAYLHSIEEIRKAYSNISG